MKVINANNIEKWMFDYFEGNLSLHEKIELESFVRENPAYQTDFEAWSQSYFQDEPMVYTNANSLIKKGFFEDKKLLLFYAFLIGTGLLIQFLTPNEVKDSLLANKGSKQNGLTESILESNSINKDNLESINGEINNSTVAFSSNKDLHENPINTEPTEVKNLNNRAANTGVLNQEALANYDGNTKEVSQIKKSQEQTVIEDVSNANELNNLAEVIPQSSNITSNSSLTNSLSKRETETMFSYSENNIATNNSIEQAKKYSANRDLELIEYKEGIVDYKKKKTSFNHYKSKTLSKSLSRMLSRDLLLTVYNNRLALKSNQIGLAHNSAFAGNVSAPRLQLSYENLTLVSQNDFTFAFDNKIKNLNAGVGVVLSNQTDYVFNKKQAEFIYAHWFDVGGIKFTTALKGGVNQTDVNWNKIGVSGLETRPADSVNNSSDIGFNIAPSLMIKLPFAYAGLQVNDIYSSTNKYVNNFKSFEIENKASYSILMGTDYRKNLGKQFVISPQLYIDIYNDSRKTKYTFAATMQYSNLLVGAGYTNDKTFRGVVGFDVKGFRMAYNAQFDIDLYNVGGVDGIKHEVAVQYIISKKKSGILLYD